MMMQQLGSRRVLFLLVSLLAVELVNSAPGFPFNDDIFKKNGNGNNNEYIDTPAPSSSDAPSSAPMIGKAEQTDDDRDTPNEDDWWFGFNSPCEVGWEKKYQELKSYQSKWEKNLKSKGVSCYNMTVYRSCFCPEEYRGPWIVAVRDDVVVEANPVNPNNTAPDFDPITSLYTMNGFFDLVYQDCFKGCPDVGADQCQMTYAKPKDGSYLTSLAIDLSFQIADEEVYYDIYNLTFCDEFE